jgi:hypothetical protein
VHILGIVHDAPSNFHDIARVVEAVQPEMVTLECLPSLVSARVHRQTLRLQKGIRTYQVLKLLPYATAEHKVLRPGADHGGQTFPFPQARSYTAAARRLAPLLDALSQQDVPLESEAQALLPTLDTQVCLAPSTGISCCQPACCASRGTAVLHPLQQQRHPGHFTTISSPVSVQHTGTQRPHPCLS